MGEGGRESGWAVEGVRSSLDGGDEADVSTCSTTTSAAIVATLGAAKRSTACRHHHRCLQYPEEAHKQEKGCYSPGFCDNMSARMYDVAVPKPSVNTGI